MEKEVASDVFELTEDSIYKMMENLKDNHCVDQTLVYCFIKAFYLHTIRLYLSDRKSNIEYNNLYSEYKERLKEYYKTNNPDLEDQILDYILNFFDNSLALIDTIEFTDVDNSYEFRHHVIKTFEILRMILENKSQSTIRENIFENYTRIVIDDCENIFKYFEK